MVKSLRWEAIVFEGCLTSMESKQRELVDLKNQESSELVQLEEISLTIYS